MTAESTAHVSAPVKAPQALTDLLMQCGRAHARVRLRRLEAFAVECATEGQTFEEFIASVQRSLDRHDYGAPDPNNAGALVYDSRLLLADLTLTSRRIDRMYAEVLATHRPRTAAELDRERQQERESAAYAAEHERRAAGKPQAVAHTYDPLTEAERTQAKRASGPLYRKGHRMGWFRHVQGNPAQLVAECGRCSRWASVDANTGAMAGTAVEERCER